MAEHGVKRMNLTIPGYLSNLFPFIQTIRDQDIILFGAASSGKRAVINLLTKGIEQHHLFFFDNNVEKWGKTILGIKILSDIEFRKKAETNCPIIVTCAMYEEINSQLKVLGYTNVHYIRSLLYAEQYALKYNNQFLNLLEAVKDRCHMEHEEKFSLYSSMQAISNLKGDIAEVGVYKGGSAKILCGLKGDKSIHLFDTFEGLPKNLRKDDLVKTGWLNDVNVNDVKDYLREYSDVFFYKGLFPDTASPVQDKQFCFVHLDTDIYQGTLDSLKFFWPRMVKGGRIISHDYNNVDCPGVIRAFSEFFIDTPEAIIEIADSQGMVIKH